MFGFPLMFIICLPVSFLCLLGFCRKQGFWETLIKVFCLFFATMFALNFYEPLANLLDKMMLKCAFYNDMWAFLTLFVFFLWLNVFITNRFSRFNLYFPKRENKIMAAICLVVLFIGFYSVGAVSFLYRLPEAPSKALPSGKDAVISNPTQFRMIEYFSKYSLAPLSGDHHFNYNEFYLESLRQKCAVYSQVCGGTPSSNGPSWAFTGSSSPNLKK